MPRPFPALSAEARRALRMSQNEFAVAIASSQRTVSRWETGRSAPAPFQIQAIADIVRPHSATIADELDALAPRFSPAPAAPIVPPPPPAAPRPSAVLLDSVVCAAAEAMSLAPQSLRPALLAAFARAKEAELTMDAVIDGLTPAAKGPA